MSLLLDALRAETPACVFLTDAADMAPYLTDWRNMFQGQALCVARPENVDEVSAVVRFASRHGIGIVPQGGNTGLSGGATPCGNAPQIVLSLGRMRAIRRVDRVSMTMEVEAGCVLQRAKDAAQVQGRFLPITFAAQGSAMVGGMIATNAGGINALRYGTVRQMILGMEAVLADGTIVRNMKGLRKDNTGYDWKHWLIGSEGTLGIITAALLRLTSLPRERCVAFAAVATTGHALRLLERLQDTVGDSLSAFELMSGLSVERATRFVGGRLPVAPASWYVLVEVADSAPLPGERMTQVLEAAMQAEEIEDAAVAESLTQADQFWALRENITEAERHAGSSIKHDVAVAVTDVPAFIDEATRKVAALSSTLVINAFGHLGDGNIHFNVMHTDPNVTALAVNRTVHDVVATFGGSIAAEHGIGQYRICEMERLKAPAELALMRRIKHTLDPLGLLNPGKVLTPSQAAAANGCASVSAGNDLTAN